MSQITSRRAISFTANTTRFAMQNGFKRGIAKAAEKVNPVTMVLEAAYSVAEAVGSYYKLQNAKKIKEGLEDYIPEVEKKLENEREALKSKVRVLERGIDLKQDLQKDIGEVVLLCGKLYKDTSSALKKVGNNDLANIKDIQKVEEDLNDAWIELRRALQTYIETVN